MAIFLGLTAGALITLVSHVYIDIRFKAMSEIDMTIRELNLLKRRLRRKKDEAGVMLVNTLLGKVTQDD